MARGNWVVRAALAVAIAGTVWGGVDVMTSHAAGTAAPQPAAATPWTGTWGDAPQSGGTTRFAQQTYRDVVHTSISGTAARIHLSNVFGSQPVTIADVHVANSTSPAQAKIDTASDRAVTFGGQTTTTIPAGGSVVSDSIAFSVGAESDVDISMYLPNAVTSEDFHQTGLQNTFVTAGDVSTAADFANPQTFQSGFFVTGLDVQNPAAAGAVVTLGASITDGISSANNDNRRWPNDLANRLVGSGRTVGVLNEGISGNDELRDGAGQSALNRFTRDVLQQPNVKWVIYSDDPINDLGGTGAIPTSDQLITGLKQLISEAHQANLVFLCSTLTPAAPRTDWTQTAETAREAINAFIRGTNSGCDGVVDQDTATHDPANPTTYLKAFNSGDNLHPNEDGLQAIANAVNLDTFAPAGTTPIISLRAHANGKFVTAPEEGASPLIASSTTAGKAEQFQLQDLGDNNVSLTAQANGNLVTADNAGTSPLIANRTARGPWETFRLDHNSDGSISLFAYADNEYVTAENAGAAPLIANRTAIGPWEEFDVVQ
jgi:lysophospholipase L1-like esterase